MFLIGKYLVHGSALKEEAQSIVGRHDDCFIYRKISRAVFTTAVHPVENESLVGRMMTFIITMFIIILGPSWLLLWHSQIMGRFHMMFGFPVWWDFETVTREILSPTVYSALFWTSFSSSSRSFPVIGGHIIRDKILRWTDFPTELYHGVAILILLHSN